MKTIVHHQRPATAQVRPGHQLARPVLTETQFGREGKGAAGARDTFDADVPSHELHQLFADRQSETGSAELAGGRRIRLGKALEQATDLLLRHTDAGVAHAKLQDDPGPVVLRDVHGHSDFACAGEFHGVVDEIQEHLAESQRIADEIGRDCGVDVNDELESFFLALAGTQVDGRSQQLLQSEGRLLQRQLARFNLREVQDVVDHAQQMLPRSLHLAHVIPLAGRQLGLQHQV